MSLTEQRQKFDEGDKWLRERDKYQTFSEEKQLNKIQHKVSK